MSEFDCKHSQCCLCLRRECQLPMTFPRFKKFGTLMCCVDCMGVAVHVAYEAARRLGNVVEKPCGRAATPSAQGGGGV
jgi:hypothetical protein